MFAIVHSNLYHPFSLQCVNLVRLLVLSVQFVAKILQIDFLHLLPDTMLFKPANEGKHICSVYLLHPDE